jgi:lipoprotein-anchoring transpeptidase ErfK/SrfK
MGAREDVAKEVEPTRRRRWPMVAVGGGAAAVVLGGALTIAALHGSTRPTAGRTSVPVSARRATTRRRPPPPPRVPLRVESTSPARDAQDISYSPVVTIRLSAPLAPGSPLPSLSPSIPGTWTRTRDELVFRSRAEYLPDTTVHLTIPGGGKGLREAGGEVLPATLSSSFTVAGGSVRRLQQLLAALGYLPVTFVPSAKAASGATAADEVPLSPVAGHFVWRYRNTPASLEQLWSPDQYTVVTRGAVMAFESAVGLDTDGEPGRLVWQALLRAVAHHQVDPNPYAYIMVSENLPETLTVWQAGKDVESFPCNTGIPDAPTEQGTFTVYARYLTTTMSGYNPDGSYYSDPGIPWVAYFNGGDAIHGFWRYGYGYPQSLGCVELIPDDAEQVWPYDQLGTLVTVA